MGKIVLLSAIYSDNLGDGVLALASENIVSRNIRKDKLIHLDISGRDGFASIKTGGQTTHKLKQVFLQLPNIFKYLATTLGWICIFKPRLKRKLKQLSPHEIDQLIVSGGQLISDVYWNFPLKLSYIVKWAERNDVRVSFLAVGVAAKYSLIGRMLLKKALTSKCVDMVGTRDKNSIANLLEYFDINGVLVPDPGLWISNLYPRISKSPGSRIGVGVSSPSELELHANLAGSFSEHTDFWIKFINEIKKLGHTPALFTNGSSDDEQFKKHLIRTLKDLQADNGIEVIPAPDTPKTLSQTISSFDALISHRLHASIIAHSYGLPTIGLKWDSKLLAYYKMIESEQFCMSMSSVSKTVDTLLISIKQGAPSAKVEILKSCTAKALDNLLRVNS